MLVIAAIILSRTTKKKCHVCKTSALIFGTQREIVKIENRYRGMHRGLAKRSDDPEFSSTSSIPGGSKEMEKNAKYYVRAVGESRFAGRVIAKYSGQIVSRGGKRQGGRGVERGG